MSDPGNTHPRAGAVGQALDDDPLQAAQAALQQTSRHGRSVNAPPPRPGWLDEIFLWLSKLIIVAMVALIGAELIARNLFGFSFEVSDEYAGYMLAALSFSSLCVGQGYGYFHRVEFIQARLPEWGQALSSVVFDILSTIFCLVVLWQMYLLERGSWDSGELASTIMMTPLWIPQFALPIGAAALCLSVIKSLVRDVVWLSGARRRRRGA